MAFKGTFLNYNSSGGLIVSQGPERTADEIVVNPAFVARRLRIGGYLTGTGTVTLRLRKGGAHPVFPIGFTGTVFYTSSPMTGPIDNFVLDAGIHGMTETQRLHLTAECATLAGVTIELLYYEFY